MNKEEELLRKKSPVSIRNKKASFEYYFVDNGNGGYESNNIGIDNILL